MPHLEHKPCPFEIKYVCLQLLFYCGKTEFTYQQLQNSDAKGVRSIKHFPLGALKNILCLEVQSNMLKQHQS